MNFARGRELHRWQEQVCARCERLARFRVVTGSAEFFSCGTDLPLLLDGLAVRGNPEAKVTQYRMSSER